MSEGAPGGAHRPKGRRCCIRIRVCRSVEQQAAADSTRSSMWVLPEKFEEGLVDEKGELLSKR